MKGASEQVKAVKKFRQDISVKREEVIRQKLQEDVTPEKWTAVNGWQVYMTFNEEHKATKGNVTAGVQMILDEKNEDVEYADDKYMMYADVDVKEPYSIFVNGKQDRVYGTTPFHK